MPGMKDIPTLPSPSLVLAGAAAATTWTTLPPAVREIALDLFADALAVIAGGATHPDVKRLTQQVKAADGPSTMIAEMRGTPLRDALTLNATATTVLQRQDGYSHAKGHPASQLVPLLLGLAERDAIPSFRLLEAFVGGYEVAARVGVAMGGVPGWLHDIGNWANIGLAAGAAHLLSHGDARVIAAAIESAAALGLGFDRFTTAGGATSHHLCPAIAVTQALTAAEGAAAGLTPLNDSLTRFYGPRFGADFVPAKLGDGIDGDGGWARFEILNGYFKLHPSCAHLQGVNDAIDMLIAEENLKEADVAHIDITTFADAIAIDAAHPQNDLAARFSARATVAAAIRYGKLDDPHLLDLGALAPLMARIDVRHDPVLDIHTPVGRPGIVRVQRCDGSILERRVIYPRGTPITPATRAERAEKAMMLLTRHYGASQAQSVVNAVRALGDGAPVENLSRTLRMP